MASLSTLFIVDWCLPQIISSVLLINFILNFWSLYSKSENLSYILSTIDIRVKSIYIPIIWRKLVRIFELATINLTQPIFLFHEIFYRNSIKLILDQWFKITIHLRLPLTTISKLHTVLLSSIELSKWRLVFSELPNLHGRIFTCRYHSLWALVVVNTVDSFCNREHKNN